MATGDNSGGQNYGQHEEQEKSKKRRRVLWIVIVLMLLINGFLLFQYFSNKSEIEETTEELVSSENLREELEKELADYEAKVSEYEGEIDELDTMLARKNKELGEQADRIRDLLSQNRITVAKYQEALEELETLRYYTKKYSNQIDSLVKVNEQLTEQNVNLKQTVREKTIQADKLKDQNVFLENKVALGSRLEAEEIDVTGIKVKNNGSEKETMNTSKMDQIKVCFQLKENVIAEKGKRDVMVKITDPSGETLYIEGTGSGEFEYKGQTSLYTVKQTILFENKEENYCVYWRKGDEFEEGKYTVELYTNGYLVGGKNFELNSGFSLF